MGLRFRVSIIRSEGALLQINICGTTIFYLSQTLHITVQYQIKVFLLITYFLKLHLHHFSKIKSHIEVTKQ
jgi:hypothetical protein